MRFTIFQESRKGSRKLNQDRIAYTYGRDTLLMVIADGMGGHAGGEIAAQICARLFIERFQQEANPVLKNPLKFLQDTMLRAHAALTRELSADLQREHGLTINDYEVLLHLSRADDARLRGVDLAERVLLTASGITRLLDGLERSGFVCRETCPGDARVSYAKLTEVGREKLRRAGDTHLRGIDELFNARYSDEERATLAAFQLRAAKVKSWLGKYGSPERWIEPARVDDLFVEDRFEESRDAAPR